jgi:hypothetical protein
MKTKLNLLAAGTFLAATSGALATVRYVDGNSANPTPPYTNWTSAAHVIQDAVDAAQAGDEILVTDGIYAIGGRAVGTNFLVNRVAVDKPLTVRSVNGPEMTIIQGYQVPGTTNGDGAIRCVFLANGANLSGFTLTNGATRSDGDWDREQCGGGVWCEPTNAVVFNCVLTRNSASRLGGGVIGGTLNNCALSGNSAWGGGGAYGRGYYGGTLNNCTLTGNTASIGGGTLGNMLNNCVLTGNSADQGGGAFEATLNNCTLTGNSALDGGGADGFFDTCFLNNCIVCFNAANHGANYAGNTWLNYCCTTPMPFDGLGNITVDPQLASASHLSASSPCCGAGSDAYATGTDIDGEAWASPPSIGCDEYHAGAVTGPLSVAIVATFTNVATGFKVGLTAVIGGRTTASAWDFGDSQTASNRPYTSHAWLGAGDYAVVLRAYNESQPGGISATVSVHVVTQPVHYVVPGSGNPLAPYTSWDTAAANIQDAVDVAALPGALVLVTNGMYATGGRAVYGTMTNRLAVDKPVVVRSVKGPQFTVIQGYQVPGTTNGDGAIRCVYLANDGSLSGFTLTNGATRSDGDADREGSGGGVWCECETAVVSNCVVTGNSSAAWGGGGTYGGTLNNCTLTANSAADSGGGAFGSTLNNCILIGNSAGSGGGAYESTLNNCTVTRNSALTDANGNGGYGGGAYRGTLNNCTLTGNSAFSSCGGACLGTLNNCIVYFNTATNGANFYQDQYEGILNYCCTTPMPTNGVGNITNAPLFEDYAGGNLRLQSNSPCINAGLTAYAPGPKDLDGLPRIVSGTVDIGAYEFQGPGSTISYAWLQQYGLPTDGSADFTDPDRDGLNNWQEWRCGTCPTSASSALRLLSPQRTGTNVTVTWQSVAGVSYLLECCTSLSPSPLFTPLATGIPGQPGTTSFTDTDATNAGLYFYRVGVGN